MTSLFKTPKAPPAPDPVQLAQQQSAANAETARLNASLNRLNEVTPYGNVTYSQTGPDQYQRTISLNPEQQQALNYEQQLDTRTNKLALDQFGRIGSKLDNPFTLDGLPAAPAANDNARQRVEDALYGRATARLDPQFTRDEESLRTRLANQGIAQGSAAYNTEMQNFGNVRNDAYAAARDQAIAAGGAEQSRLFGLEDVARQRAIGERVQERSQPINELAALLGTGQVQGYQPGAIAQTNVANTDVIGANSLASSIAMNQYNQQMGSRNALLGALGGIAGGAAGGYFTGVGLRR